VIEGDGEPRFVDPIRAEITVPGASEGPLAGATVVHGPFITAHRPRIAPDIADRFAAAQALCEQGDTTTTSPSSRALDFATAQRRASDALDAVAPGAVIVLPSAPSGATEPFEPADTRARLLSLTCLAGLAGAPQVSLPLCRVAGVPLGLGLLARPGEDELLLAAAAGCN
jgi:amidase